MIRINMHKAYLVSRKNAEWIDDLLCCISVSSLTCHEVQERIKVHITCWIGIHNSKDTLEVNLTLTIFANAVSQTYKAWLELLRC